MAKKKQILHFILILAAVIFANVLAQNLFFRIDLTEENRYSMNDATKKVLEELQDQVYIEVYLEGDFPSGFKRLQKAVKETLNEFKIYGGKNIQFTFTDPNDFPTNKARNQFHQNLTEKGMQPSNLVDMEDGKRTEKIMFPWAVVRYGLKEIPILLLTGNQSNSTPQEQLNASIENLEYALVDGIRKITQSEYKKKIAFIEGHGELNMFETRDIELSLSEYYDVARVHLPSVVNLDQFDLIIVAKPDTAIHNHDVFKIDQHIVKGGKAIFLVDPMRIHLDSVGEEGTYSFPLELGLNELLFKYGVRINNDLIQDFYSALLPMVTGYVGEKSQTQLMPWRFYPVINNFSNHPITKNLGPVLTKFVSTIDTVKAKGINKIPLLLTSKNSRIFPAPVRVNFNDARLDLEPSIFKNGPLPIGYLLEGKFESMFKNRLTKDTKETFNYKEKGEKPTKVIVFSDGDIIRNEVSPKKDKILPLGYDRYMRITFANRDLIMNAVDYLIDDSGLMQARTKKVELRPLDKEIIKKDRSKWQLINLLIPIVIVLIFGILYNMKRKRDYTRFV